MLSEETRQTIRDVLAQRKALPGALLPVLHGVQDAVGHVPAQAVDEIAGELNLSRAEVHGVITYYHHFRSEPAGRTVVQICRAEACKSMGADALWSHAKSRLGCAAHGTTLDGAFTLEPVYCLGLCASSPAIMLGDRLHARVNPGSLDRLLEAARVAV